MTKVLPVLAILCTACSTPAGPSEERQLGLLYHLFPDGPMVVVPDTVRAGEPFVVRLTTSGDGCVRGGETEVQLSEEVMVIRPYDYVDTGRDSCERILKLFEHEAEGVFEEPGTKSVLVWGREPSSLDTIQVAQTVVVTVGNR